MTHMFESAILQALLDLAPRERNGAVSASVERYVRFVAPKVTAALRAADGDCLLDETFDNAKDRQWNERFDHVEEVLRS